MYITMMKSKIHRAKVTDANLNYVGSITLDEDLMEASDIIENEKVQIVNNNNGKRFETYVIPGQRGSGTICLNGAAARLAHPGDIIIIMAYGILAKDEVVGFKPRIVILDENNMIANIRTAEQHGHIE
jgi:aspartate 1-decarboxylase